MQENREYKMKILPEFEQKITTIEREEDEIDEELLELAFKVIEKEQKRSGERIKKYELVFAPLYKIFSVKERADLLEHPVDFCSETLLFRGLTHK